MALQVLSKEAAALAAKRAARRGEKFMGMAEEVPPQRLTDETMRAGSRGPMPPSSRMAGKAALGLGAAGVAGLAAMSGKDEESLPKRVSAAPRGEDMPVREEAAPAPSKASAESPAKKKKSGELSPFGKKFKESRAAGLSVFEFNGKKYNTMLAGESKEEHKSAIERIKEKNEAAYEKKMKELSDTKEPEAFKKGGMVQKKWIGEAIKKPGALRKSMGVKSGSTIPKKALQKATKAPGITGQRARLAVTLSKMNKGKK